MDSNDADLEAFESKLCQILQRLQHLCPIFSKTHQTLNWSGYQTKKMLNTNPPAAPHVIASLIQKIYLMLTKHPQNGSAKGISMLQLATGQQGKLMKTQFWQQWKSSIYQLFLFLSTAWKFFTILLQNQTGSC